MPVFPRGSAGTGNDALIRKGEGSLQREPLFLVNTIGASPTGRWACGLIGGHVSPESKDRGQLSRWGPSWSLMLNLNREVGNALGLGQVKTDFLV